MKIKYLCVGVLFLLFASQVDAFNTPEETAIMSMQSNKDGTFSEEKGNLKANAVFKKIACLITIMTRDTAERARRHGVGGAFWGCALGHFLGNAVVYAGIGIASAGAGAVGFVVGGPAGSGVAATTTFYSLQATVVPLAQPFIHSLAIAGGIGGAVATGPV